LLEASLCSGAVRSNDSNKRSVLVLQSQARGDRRRHFLDLHTEPAAAHLAMLLQLRHHGFCQAGGHGEANPDAAAIGRVDCGIDADYLAVQIECRAARIPAVYWRIDLEGTIGMSGM